MKKIASLMSVFAFAAQPVLAAETAPAADYIVRYSLQKTNHLWLPGREMTEEECPRSSGACAIDDARLVKFDYQSYLVVAENPAHEFIQCVGLRITPESPENGELVRQQSFTMGVADPLLYQFLMPSADNDHTKTTLSFGNCIHFDPSEFLEFKNTSLGFYEHGRSQGTINIPYGGLTSVFKNVDALVRSEHNDFERLSFGSPSYDLLEPRSCSVAGYQERLAAVQLDEILKDPAFCP